MICRSPFYDLVKRIYWTSVNLLPSEIAIKIHYLRIFKKWPNLKEPRTFNEKINWRKLYQHNPDFITYADKIAVKEIVAKKIGGQYIIPTLWMGTNAGDIPFEKLEPPYIIKVNNNSGGHVFVRDRKDIDRDAVVRQMNALMSRPPSNTFHEWGYEGIKPQILVERLIEISPGVVPDDYKFMVFHGRALYIQIDQKRFLEGQTRSYFNRDWEWLSFTRSNLPSNKAQPCPQHFEEMIQLAETLGKDFDFVRIDLYDTPQGIYFGEATFYPAAGYGPFVPDAWDLLFGQAWQIGEAKNSP